MFNDDTLKSRSLDVLAGALIFFTVVTGATYYLQSSLIIVKKYDAYTHWAVILICVPLVAGLVMRQVKLVYPLISSLIGAMLCAAVLYPLYKGFWAEPPTIADLVIYVAAVLGIGYIATQPLRTTFMIAFRIGRFSVPKFTTNTSNNKNKKGKKPAARKSSMTKTQRLQTNEHGNIIAMLELLIGVTSLALSIFSIFFLGRS